MRNKESTAKQNQYTIEIEGHLDDRWQEWFEEFTFNHTVGGRTLLCGPIQDQAALQGVLKKLSKLGLKLISLNPQERSKDKLSINKEI